MKCAEKPQFVTTRGRPSGEKGQAMNTVRTTKADGNRSIAVFPKTPLQTRGR